MSIEVWDRAAKSVGHHPQADHLLRSAAVAFCRRPCVWDRDGNKTFRPAVELARRFPLGFASDSALEFAGGGSSKWTQ